MEYITEQFVTKFYEEIISEELNLLISHTLIKTQAKDSIRASQVHAILKPLIAKLNNKYKTKKLFEAKLSRFFIKIKEEFTALPGYEYRNIINLLCQIKTDLNSYKFSRFIVQPYLEDRNIERINADFHLDKSVFSNTVRVSLQLHLVQTEDC